MSAPDCGPRDASTSSASAVALRVADFLIRFEVERLHLFRLHLHTSVRLVTPLLLDLAALEGISLTDALALLAPPQYWPWRPLYDRRPSLMRHAQRRKNWLRAVGSRHEWHFERTFANPGVVIRKIDHPHGRFAIRPCGPMLGFTAGLGPCLLSAFGSTAMLKLSEPLPQTFMAAMAGRKLDQVIDHPLFAGKKYVIRHVKPDDDDLPIIAFGAKLVPFAISSCCTTLEGE